MTDILDELANSDLSPVSDAAVTDVSSNTITESPVGITIPAENTNTVKSNESEDAVLERLLSYVVPVGKRVKWLKCLFYGPPGTGKTVFGATSPEPYIYDVENSSLSLNNHPELNGVMVMEYKSLGQLEALLGYFERKHPSFEKYQTFVVDTFSELQKKDLDGLITEDVAVGKDYQRNTERMRRLMVRIRDLPMHVIFICHSKEEKDEGTGIIKIRPDLTPILSTRILAACDVVGYLTNILEGDEVKERRLQVRPSRGIVAKTRVGHLPAIIIDPSFDDIIEASK